ncbi:amidohydrolase family protein [Actinopolymorpha sp. B17G11]|uniref:amidohydrolase family protein n=1 Tax=Actinopolymorpha sp. B17G11 TaxID=3160861 RepID=UPI0032E3C216
MTGLDLPLVDGHCHVVVDRQPDRQAFELFLTEATQPAPTGVSYADSQLGLALRRWCAPPLGLPPGAPLEEYLVRRTELPAADVRRRLLEAAGLSHLLVDTGLGATGSVSLPQLASAARAEVRPVVRLERVAEDLASSGVSAEDFADAYAATLVDATRDAVAVKSILAYRHGFAVPATRPGMAEVRDAARGWLANNGRHRAAEAIRQWRLDDPVLLRFVLWCGLDRGLPVQLHTGFGDRDLRLTSVNPALLQGLFEAAEPTGTPIVLLHCYPYHREAGWLAAVHPYVYVDVGLTVAHAGIRAEAILGEFCELAPFRKLLYSSDAYGLPELYLVGAAQFREAFGRLLDSWRRQGALTLADADRIGAMVGADNARRLYSL